MSCYQYTETEGSGYVALNILNATIDSYEQRQCNQLAGTIPIQCGSVCRMFSPFTSLHTTGSLCVPVDERTDKTAEFPRKYVKGRSTVKAVIHHNKNGFF